MGRADRNFQLRSLEDARQYRIGTYNGDARDQYLRERGFTVDPAQNDLVNPQKLLMGRIDLWAASLRRSSTVIAQNGWGAQIVPVLSFYRTQVYLACNPGVPDELIGRMHAALESMVRDGTVRRIEQKADGIPRAAE
jgi:polar amino acid transport system substrate-binding protein